MRIGYARVSTQDQSTDLQVDALWQAGCDDVFVEKVSGTRAERPKLNECLRMLRTNDKLVVWRLDRLGRSLQHLVTTVGDLERRGIGFESLNEKIDTGSAGGKLIFHLFGALAEFESNLNSERTRAGLQAARARGRKGGRKPKMSKADVRKAAAMLKDPEITKTEVARHFGVTRLTLNGALKREGYPLNPAGAPAAT